MKLMKLTNYRIKGIPPSLRPPLPSHLVILIFFTFFSTSSLQDPSTYGSVLYPVSRDISLGALGCSDHGLDLLRHYQ